jgi:NAD(P)-dependent dehydrogenase (short-subunit alcohol dehydrogenase family)
MAARTILLTGAYRGLGRAMAERLVHEGHHLLLSARSREKADAVCEALRRQQTSAQVEPIVIDLASLESIRRFSQGFGERSVDVLYHCAGILQQSRTRRTTVDGFEETLGVNVLAPMLLSRLLLPSLRRSRHPRIVCVSSRLHRPGLRGPGPHVDFGDPDLASGYQPDLAYKNSKLALLWFVYELARRLPASEIGVHAICPGFVPVTAAAGVRGFTRFFMLRVLRYMPFATSVETAAKNLADLATNPALDGQTATYWEDGQQVASSPESLDPERARRFFDWACQRLQLAEW